MLGGRRIRYVPMAPDPPCRAPVQGDDGKQHQRPASPAARRSGIGDIGWLAFGGAGTKGEERHRNCLEKRGKGQTQANAGQTHMTRAAKAMFRAFTALSLQRS
jgi:hypothetical protein